MKCSNCGENIPQESQFCGKCGADQTSSMTVVFPDKNLEAAVRKAINRPEGTLTRADLKGLRKLNAYYNDIKDISCLEYAVNLTGLWLNDNGITDLTPLASLTNLVRLELTQNQITDISPLSSLTNLGRLELTQNQITDISPLASLTKLTGLGLNDNQITDISPLASLTNLVRLELTSNSITDISPLTSLTNLFLLNLANNQITDISPLTSLTKLTKTMLGDQFNDNIVNRQIISTLKAKNIITDIDDNRMSFDEQPTPNKESLLGEISQRSSKTQLLGWLILLFVVSTILAIVWLIRGA